MQRCFAQAPKLFVRLFGIKPRSCRQAVQNNQLTTRVLTCWMETGTRITVALEARPNAHGPVELEIEWSPCSSGTWPETGVSGSWSRVRDSGLAGLACRFRDPEAPVCFCLLGSALLVAFQPRRSEKQMVVIGKEIFPKKIIGNENSTLYVVRTTYCASESPCYRLLLTFIFAAGPKAGRINAAFIGPGKRRRFWVCQPDAQCNHSHERAGKK